MKHISIALALVAAAGSLPATATIIDGTVTGGTAQLAGGVFVKLTVPLANPFGPVDSVGNDNFQSPNLFGFDEDQNITLSAPLAIDVGASPIPAGTIVASHYMGITSGSLRHSLLEPGRQPCRSRVAWRCWVAVWPRCG